MPEHPGAPRGPAAARQSQPSTLTALHLDVVDQFYSEVFEEACRVATGKTRNRHTREDIAAVVALKMCTALKVDPTLGSDRALRTRRISRCVTDEWKNIRRGEKRSEAAIARLAERTKPLAERTEESSASLGLSPEVDFNFNEAQRRIDAWVGALSPKKRDVFTLVRTQNNTIAAAARKLRRPIGTVKSDLKRAVDELRIAAAHDPNRGNA